MGDVIDDLVTFAARVAGVVLEEVEDGPDLQAFAASIGRAGFALGVLHERGETRKRDMARWKPNGNGGVTLDLSAQPTPQEVAAGERKIAEMIAARQAPAASKWDPRAIMTTTGLSFEQARNLFPTQAHWNGYLRAAGKEEVGGSDLKDQGIKRPTPTCKADEAAALDLIQQGLAQLKNTGRWDGKSDTVNTAVPLIPLEDVGPKNGTNKPPDPTIAEITGVGQLDEDPKGAVGDVPMSERPVADLEDLGASLYEAAKHKGLARSEAQNSKRRF